MRIFTYILLSGILSAFLSCEKIIEPKDLPEQEPRIVLNSVLATDSFITATISSSKSILSGKDYKYINNAVCEVYEDDVYVQNLVFSGNGKYVGSVLPKVKKKYTVKVAAPGFETISATTSISPLPKITPVELYDTAGISYIRKKHEADGKYYINSLTKLRFKIIDDPTIKNHYALNSYIILFDSLGQVISLEDYAASIIPYGTRSYDNFMDINGKDFFEGKEITIDVGLHVLFEETLVKSHVKKIQSFLQVLDLNEDYYRYYQTSRAQATVRGSLFAEPVQVYTNVEKGMGILAGENILTIPVYNGTVVDQ